MYIILNKNSLTERAGICPAYTHTHKNIALNKNTFAGDTAISFRVHSGLQKFVLISFLKAAPCMPFFKFSNEGMQGAATL